MASASTGKAKGVSFSITVYGATSYVAKYVLRYLIESSEAGVLTPPLSITLGGRTESKLEAVKDAMKKEYPKGHEIIKDVFVASGSDIEALKTMAARTGVVLNCAGPYSKYSSHVVGACAEVGTDYVDFTGEVAWNAEMRQTYGEKSKASGARIISFCGFDSIPSDMSVLAAVQSLYGKCGNNVQIESARIVHEMFGLPSGGTVQTAANLPVDLVNDFTIRAADNKRSLRKVPFFLGDPLYLTHPTKVRHNPGSSDIRDKFALSEWMNQLPNIETNFTFAPSIPMPMAMINLKIVQASAVALGYGKDFTVKERFFPLGFLWSRIFGIFALFPILMVMWFTIVFSMILKLPVIGKVMVDFVAPSGSGMPDWMGKYCTCAVYTTVTAPSVKAEGTDKVDRGYCYMSFEGDAGNLVTAQCVAEAAMTLIYNRSELPPRNVDGFGTPAELLGGPLLKRFQETKVRPVKIVTKVRTATSRYEMSTYTT